MKALHPADEKIAGTQLPDGVAFNTVPVEYCISYTANADSLSTAIATPWGIDAVFSPHPTSPLGLYFTGGASAATPVALRVPALAHASGINYDLSVLSGLAESWRITFASVTMHLDANSTKDSGTVYAAQQVMRPYMIHPHCDTAGMDHPPVTYYQVGDAPTATTISSIPRYYNGNMRKGLYMPLKLSNTTQHWFSAREMHGLTLPSNISAAAANLGTFTLGTTATGTTWPIPGLSVSHLGAGTGNVEGGNTAAFMGDNFGFVFVNNLDPGAGVVFKVKLGLELRVRASSALAAHTQPPASVDNRALTSYFRIVRELEDAWPADYNDAARIMNVISRVIKTITPALEMIPVVGPIAGMVAGPVAAGLKRAGKEAAARQKKRKRREAVGTVVLRKAMAKTPTLVARR